MAIGTKIDPSWQVGSFNQNLEKVNLKYINLQPFLTCHLPAVRSLAPRHNSSIFSYIIINQEAIWIQRYLDIYPWSVAVNMLYNFTQCSPLDQHLELMHENKAQHLWGANEKQCLDFQPVGWFVWIPATTILKFTC